MKLLSIVFSFKNEEKNLQELTERTAKSLSDLTNWKYEMIFVNDSSDDKSEEILLDLQKTNPITIINMTRTFGVGPCVLAGFRHAKGDVIIYMDTDLQDPPEIIIKFVEKISEGYDVVYGLRNKRKGSFFKNLSYKIFYQVFYKVIL